MLPGTNLLLATFGVARRGNYWERSRPLFPLAAPRLCYVHVIRAAGRGACQDFRAFSAACLRPLGAGLLRRPLPSGKLCLNVTSRLGIRREM